jgi:hypothetical protein
VTLAYDSFAVAIAFALKGVTPRARVAAAVSLMMCDGVATAAGLSLGTRAIALGTILPTVMAMGAALAAALVVLLPSDTVGRTPQLLAIGILLSFDNLFPSGPPQPTSAAVLAGGTAAITSGIGAYVGFTLAGLRPGIVPPRLGAALAAACVVARVSF